MSIYLFQVYFIPFFLPCAGTESYAKDKLLK